MDLEYFLLNLSMPFDLVVLNWDSGFAQQGSIYSFVVLIFVYVWLMNKLDKEFDVDEK